MFEIYDAFTLSVRSFTKKIENLFSVAAISCFVTGCFYMLYWSLAINDGIVIEFTGQYFSKLVSLFFSDTNLLENYLYTGFYMSLLTIPFVFAHYLTSKTREILIDIHNNIKEKKHKIAKQKEKKEALKEYTEIDKYSICISLDFSENKSLKPDFEKEIYAYAIKKIKHSIKEVKYDATVNYHNAIVICSDDFKKYDEIYSRTLKELANIKNLIKGSIKFTPTITIDAYTTDKIDIDKTVKNHYGIIKCNLHNRATSSAAFLKKYTYLNQNKYAGLPIGLYSTFENKHYKEYDLNIVHKNLVNTLNSLAS